MPLTRNGTLLYIQHPAPHSPLIPGVHTLYVEEDIDLEYAPLNGGVLIKTIAFSSDPYLRYRMRNPAEPSFCPVIPLKTPVDNTGVGKVLRSEDPKFKPGDYVMAYMDFQEYAIYPGLVMHAMKHIVKIQRTPGIPLKYYCGVLGTTGRTAYGGFKAFGLEKAKTSKTMFVSGAAGPVGTFVIEYAKHLFPHLKIIASAGSPAKLDLLRSLAVPVDVLINYKTDDTGKVLAEHGPIDIYWDNVSGPTLDAALANMAVDGLIIACGAISAASNNGTGSPVMNFEQIFQRDLTVRGFLLNYPPVVQALKTFYDETIPLLLDGKITVHEHPYTLDKAGEAIADLHLGKNIGKSLIIVSDEEQAEPHTVKL
ncbi:hypothetical protein NM688_g1449 [Phlebia brevispora]|uniref:Uncharacterized protein n=1 Tax=Phlebia brevispora TaxID=194682 RepID=A0ACC1TB92_9APHY|nr:hypothetical protein NM688_g1449 [Phlebia brevispora]